MPNKFLSEGELAYDHAVIEIRALETALAAEEEKRERAEKQLLSTWCAYCGKEFPLDAVTSEQIGEHIRTCENHPMRRVEQALAAEREKRLEAESKVRKLKGAIRAAIVMCPCQHGGWGEDGICKQPCDVCDPLRAALLETADKEVIE